jgi:hypothetical protein
MFQRFDLLFYVLLSGIIVGQAADLLGDDDNPTSTSRRADRDDGWIALFDGKSLGGWVDLNGQPVKRGWAVEDGMIVRTRRSGYLVTARKFGDFELVVEWKLARGTNSGIKYRVKNYGDRVLGPEYQLIDDEGYRHPISAGQRTGALYAMFPPPADVKPNPAGEWNRGRIIARGTRFEHWLNGKKIVDVDTTSNDWKHRLLFSKFITHPDFGQAPRGPIMIQDHGGKVWFRKIELREL